MQLIRRDDVIGTCEFPICDLLDDGINGEYDMVDADGNSVGKVTVSINFEAGDGMYFFNSLTLTSRLHYQRWFVDEQSLLMRMILTFLLLFFLIAVNMFDLLGSMLHKSDD